ncbi:hypothetical protein Tco_0620594 [Tanacetum coccineum]
MERVADHDTVLPKAAKEGVMSRMYNVPVVAYSEDGLSLIATQIGKPIMLDAFTSSMCVDSWGRISFARALIEIDANSELKKEVKMAIPVDEDDGSGYISEVIRVEYEWKPPHCLDCKIFGHNSEKCPKKVIVAEPTVDASANDGFTKVVSRKNKGKNDSSQTIGGIRLSKPKSNFYWQQKKSDGSKSGSNAASTSGTAKGGDKHKVPSPPRVQSNLATPVSNPFDILTAGEEIACDPSGQNPKVSEPLGGGFLLEDDDLDCYDGYEAQVDIQKAYDTVDYNFLKLTLLAFGFHTRMVAWIMECVTSTSFSICINGSLHGYFKGKRGLRQGDPMSPYLFTLIMEVLTLMLHRKIAILHVLPFEEGRLPVKYLGVPLVSSRVVYKDCRELIEKVRGRASMFVLPSRVLLDVEQIMRGFLWCQWLLKKGKANVSWDIVYRKRIEGGLGVRRFNTFNKALMVSHLWNLISSKESLWVKWIHVYKLKGRSFWEVPCHGNLSWRWRKILQLCPLIREFIWYRIRDGLNAPLGLILGCHVGFIS